jgi:DNA-binding XRE family transcriptional regulator
MNLEEIDAFLDEHRGRANEGGRTMSTVGLMVTARREAGLTQAEMAHLLGLKTRSTIAHIEQGLVDPRLSLVEAWFQVTNLTLHTRSVFRCGSCEGLFVSLEDHPHLFTHRCNAVDGRD